MIVVYVFEEAACDVSRTPYDVFPVVDVPCLGMDKFTAFFQITSDMMQLLKISLDVHVSTL